MSEVIVYSGNMTHVTAIDARGPVLLKTATGEVLVLPAASANWERVEVGDAVKIEIEVRRSA